MAFSHHFLTLARFCVAKLKDFFLVFYLELFLTQEIVIYSKLSCLIIYIMPNKYLKICVQRIFVGKSAMSCFVQ